MLMAGVRPSPLQLATPGCAMWRLGCNLATSRWLRRRFYGPRALWWEDLRCFGMVPCAMVMSPSNWTKREAQLSASCSQLYRAFLSHRAYKAYVESGEAEVSEVFFLLDFSA